MEATIINLLAVMIIGNLALMGAIPIIGILWFGPDGRYSDHRHPVVCVRGHHHEI